MTTDRAPEERGVTHLIDEAVAVCREWQRQDLIERLRLAEARLSRPATLVCVVGEYKQGKSTLVNSLVGTGVCPVDDDVATAAFTAVSAADASSARIHRTVDGHPSVEVVPIEELWRYVSERGRPSDRAGVELVEVGLTTSDLPRGLTLVDTPGVGGLVDRRLPTTLRFLRLADGVVFATDASQELTASEMRFLEQARTVCSTVLVVVTKIDLYPEWRRIVALDASHLADRSLDIVPLAVSAAAWQDGRLRQVPLLESENGIARLRSRLEDEVVEGARDRAAANASEEIEWALHRLRAPVSAELSVLEDPERAEQVMGQLAIAKQRFADLQSAGARWATVLNDGFTDLRVEVDYDLRAGLRAVLIEIDQRLEEIDPAVSWDDLVGWLQSRLSGVVAEVFGLIEERVGALNDRIAALLAEEVSPSLEPGATPLGVEELWARSDRALHGAPRGLVTSSLAALRGGSSGTIMLGMVARFAGIAVATPISLGIAVLFGIKQVADVRKQQLARRRQDARTAARQFVDEVSLEMGQRARQLTQDAHRAMRDGYSARLTELSQSAAGAVQAASAALAADTEARRERLELLHAWAARLDGLLGRLSGESAT